MYVPQAYYSVKQWYSPSGSFVQIEPVYDSVQCGSSINLNVRYTTNGDANYKFHYQVSCCSCFINNDRLRKFLLLQECIPGGSPPGTPSPGAGTPPRGQTHACKHITLRAVIILIIIDLENIRIAL